MHPERFPQSRRPHQADTKVQPDYEFGETVRDAIVREIKEELGVKIELVSYLCFTDQILKDESQHWVAISYLAKIVRGAPINLEPDKHSDMRWFSLDNLPEELSITTLDSTRSYKNLVSS